MMLIVLRAMKVSQSVSQLVSQSNNHGHVAYHEGQRRRYDAAVCGAGLQ